MKDLCTFHSSFAYTKVAFWKQQDSLYSLYTLLHILTYLVGRPSSHSLWFIMETDVFLEDLITFRRFKKFLIMGKLVLLAIFEKLERFDVIGKVWQYRNVVSFWFFGRWMQFRICYITYLQHNQILVVVSL